MSVSEDKLSPDEAVGTVTTDLSEQHNVEADVTAAEQQPEIDFSDPEAMLDALESARREIAAMKEQFLRASAETENIRRRSEQDVIKARKFGIERLATELLNVKDSLDLAANVELGSEHDSVVKGMHEGVGLTRRQLDGVFEKFDIVIVEPEAGEKLNPDLHQAMSLLEHAEIPPNHVVQVIQKGYTLNGRLLRPAMVMVAKAPTS
jgi:molecular chaperone GrpE